MPHVCITCNHAPILDVGWLCGGVILSLSFPTINTVMFISTICAAPTVTILFEYHAVRRRGSYRTVGPFHSLPGEGVVVKLQSIFYRKACIYLDTCGNWSEGIRQV